MIAAYNNMFYCFVARSFKLLCIFSTWLTTPLFSPSFQARMIMLLTTVLLVTGSALQSYGDAEQHAHVSATDEAFGGILPETRELRSLDMDAAMKKYTRVGSSPYMR